MSAPKPVSQSDLDWVRDLRRDDPDKYDYLIVYYYRASMNDQEEMLDAIQSELQKIEGA